MSNISPTNLKFGSVVLKVGKTPISTVIFLNVLLSPKRKTTNFINNKPNIDGKNQNTQNAEAKSTGKFRYYLLNMYFI